MRVTLLYLCYGGRSKKSAHSLRIRNTATERHETSETLNITPKIHVGGNTVQGFKELTRIYSDGRWFLTVTVPPLRSTVHRTAKKIRSIPYYVVLRSLELSI